jgi:hypothetical protein
LWSKAKDGQRHSVRIKLAEFGAMTTREAHAEARKVLSKIAKGVDPRSKTKSSDQEDNIRDPTLRQAWVRYRDTHMKPKGRSANTEGDSRDHVERLMTTWLDQPSSILGHNPSLVTARHDRITNENGPYIANACMRSLRAISNPARRVARSHPAENPVTAVDWNQEKRRDTALGVE